MCLRPRRKVRHILPVGQGGEWQAEKLHGPFHALVGHQRRSLGVGRHTLDQVRRRSQIERHRDRPGQHDAEQTGDIGGAVGAEKQDALTRTDAIYLAQLPRDDVAGLPKTPVAPHLVTQPGAQHQRRLLAVTSSGAGDEVDQGIHPCPRFSQFTVAAKCPARMKRKAAASTCSAR